MGFYEKFLNEKILISIHKKDLIKNCLPFTIQSRLLTTLKKKPFENKVEQERQIVARYARPTPSCKAGACTRQNSSMKNNKGHYLKN